MNCSHLLNNSPGTINLFHDLMTRDREILPGNINIFLEFEKLFNPIYIVLILIVIYCCLLLLFIVIYHKLFRFSNKV